MITFADPRSLQPESCIALNLGIGIMRPDWMQQGACQGDVWVTSKSAGYDNDYHRTTWTHIPVLDQDDGAFDWFADFTTGEGRMMQAPGPDADEYVVNEERDLLAASFPLTDVTTFRLPVNASTCIPAGSASSPRHARALLRAAGLPVHGLRVLMPELRLSYALARSRVAA